MIGLILAATIAISQPTGKVFIDKPEAIALGNSDQVVVAMSLDYYISLTNWIAKVTAIADDRWQEQHKTEAGRVKWHGKKVATYIDEQTKTQITEYEDGWRLVEDMKKKSEHKQIATRNQSKIPSRLQKIKAERESAKATKTIEKVVIHNGNEGK